MALSFQQVKAIHTFAEDINNSGDFEDRYSVIFTRGFRHLRGGKVQSFGPKEARGMEVLAVAYDNLGNCTVLKPDLTIRQYI